MPTRHANANAVVERFADGLAAFIHARGWVLQRHYIGHSDRLFSAVRGTEAIAFLVKLSQSDQGFWGMTPAQAIDFEQFPDRALVLLTGPTSGYVIAGRRVRALLPSFSQSGGQYKINEGVLRAEARFTDLRTFADLLGAQRAA